MRRILATALVLAAAGAFALFAGGAKEGDGKPRYWLQLDNAFGLIEGADFKIAGVRAGQITKLKLDRRNKMALVQFEVDRSTGKFTELRADVFCETRPQSLIGEYFIDCAPGRSPRRLREGSTVPVHRTASTIPADLVNNVMRLPERERLRIILNELGTGLAARGDDLNLALRRGVPALRETNRLLAVLARQNRVLGNLARDADAVITALADNREDVGRFVVEARDTARASSNRRVELAATFNRLPRFLAQLEPTMRELGRVADAQTPALRDLNASAGQLERFFDNLGPFAEASRPSFRSLAEASRVGSQAVRAARPTVAELRRFTRHTPELGKNLAIVLEDLADRDRAVQKDPRAPAPPGFNGLENLLGYVFWQSQAINIFDRNGYILKVAVYDNHCARYTGIQSVRKDPEEHEHCASALGPTQPGINAPDTSNPPGVARARAESVGRDVDVLDAARNAAGPPPGANGRPAPAPPAPRQGAEAPKPPIDLDRTIDQVLDGLNLPAPARDALGGALQRQSGGDPQAAGALLDYLLGS